MRSALAAAAQRRNRRARSASLSTLPPAEDSEDYLPELAAVAASILYCSPLPSPEGRPIFVLNAAAFPDAFDVDYDSLLSYVLARLPDEDELIGGVDYEILFFAGGQLESATASKKTGPNTGWYLQAYHVLGRATRKKLQRLYIVHPRTWVRVLISIFGTIVSPKFRRKIIHVNSLTALASHLPIPDLLIPPSVYVHDRRISPNIDLPGVNARRAFGVKRPFPQSIGSSTSRLPRVLREATQFILIPANTKAEGLFRVPPHSVLLGILREAYDRGQQFIVWKERGAVFAPPGMDKNLVDEIRLEDAYGVHLAASLIKLWYRELRQPIFADSSYAYLRDHFGESVEAVTVESLSELLLPTSQTSPVSKEAREILSRHLLPMLSLVESENQANKMNAENLAICFSMCLICGSNQMEDGRVASVVRRILRAAIEKWPELREKMGSTAQDFLHDLQPPLDGRNYEDTIDHDYKHLDMDAAAAASSNGRRIIMTDDVSPIDKQSLMADFEQALQLHTTFSANSQHSPVDNPPHQLKRKPAPEIQAPAEAQIAPFPGHEEAMSPPRFSVLFDYHDAEIVDEKASHTLPDTMNTGINPTDVVNQIEMPQKPAPAIVPRRKAVAGNGLPDKDPRSGPHDAAASTISELNAMLGKTALDQTAANPEATLSNPPALPPTTPSHPLPSSKPSITRKPARLAPSHSLREPSSIQSLAKPVIPTQTAPSRHTVSFSNHNKLSPPPLMPKPRTPSPGLLKRMSSMEQVNRGASASTWTRPSLEPHKLNLRKTSVDDLRRLYEERANTAHQLAEVVQMARRNSTTNV